MPFKLNELQKAVLQDYDDGAQAYLIDEDEIPDSHDFEGDPLLRFMIMELCHNPDSIDVALMALTRLQIAMKHQMSQHSPYENL